MRKAACPPLLVATLLGAGAARAQGGDLAVAQGPFDAGKHLVAQGKLADACPKFLASFKLDPKPGILLVATAPKGGEAKQAWVAPTLGPGFTVVTGRF